MGLEMKVHKEIAGYEAKAMFGRTWRQLAALAFMIFVGGGVFAAVTYGLIGLGQSVEVATNVAMYVMFPILIPAAAWGWWRPKGLKPEQFLGFFLRYQLMKRHIRYEDTYRPESDAEHTRGESVRGGETREPAERARDRRRAAAAQRRLRKTITEHPQGEEDRRQARRAKAWWRPSQRR